MSNPTSKAASDPLADGLIVIAGMHRSGTSALAGALVALGCNPPTDPMPADHSNAKGYFESVASVEQNDAFLARLGRSWRDIRAIPESYFSGAAADVDRIAEVFLRAYPADGLGVHKDPRLCMLMPLWDAAFRRTGISAVYGIALRAPGEVASSLARRDEMLVIESEALWIRHMLSIEKFTRGRPRAFVSTANLVANPVEVMHRFEQTLNIRLPKRPKDHADDLNSFVEENLMRPVRINVSPLTAFSEEIFRTLTDLVEDPHCADAMARLDEQAATFDFVSEPIAHLLLLAPVDAARIQLIDDLRKTVAASEKAGLTGATAAFPIIDLLPREFGNASLKALVADVDLLVEEMTALQSRPFSGFGKLIAHAVLKRFEPIAAMLSDRRGARHRRSREKRDPIRQQKEWERLRNQLLATGVPERSVPDPDHLELQKLAVAIHAFYADGLDEILLRFRLTKKDEFAFYVTCPIGTGQSTRLICDAHGIDAVIVEVENRGRDVLPFFTILPQIIANEHPAILKLHTKKSLHHVDGTSWKSALLTELIDADTINRVRSAFLKEPGLGLLGPKGHILDLGTFVDTSRPWLETLLRRAGMSTEALRDSIFVAGTMMFVRTSLAQDLSAMVNPEDFEPESGQTEGTLAHAVERLFGVLAKARGFEIWSTAMQPVRHGSLHYGFVLASPVFLHARQTVSGQD